MVRPLFFATLVATAATVQGHFHFVRLAHNGVWQDPLRYIRNSTVPYYEPYNPDKYQQYPNRRLADPTYYADAPNSVRCGRGNLDHAPDTEVLKVKAGDTIEFVNANIEYSQMGEAGYWNCSDGRGFCTYFSEYESESYLMKIVHAGPVSMYLSAVPSGQQISQYDGSGEWVKIKTFGVEMRKNWTKPHWLPNNNNDTFHNSATPNPPVRMPFKIPTQTPAGAYLLRVDMVFNYWNSPAQLYPACAQVLVEGNATGALPKGVKFPEVYDPSMPGMTTSYTQGEGSAVDPDYVYPGGELWTGEEMVVDKPDLTPI